MTNIVNYLYQMVIPYIKYEKDSFACKVISYANRYSSPVLFVTSTVMAALAIVKLIQNIVYPNADLKGRVSTTERGPNENFSSLVQGVLAGNLDRENPGRDVELERIVDLPEIPQKLLDFRQDLVSLGSTPSDAEIDEFLDSLSDKPYSDILYTKVALDLSNIPCINDNFCRQFFSYLKSKNFPIKIEEINFSNTNIRGEYLNLLNTFDTETLILKDIAPFREANLRNLIRLPHLKILDLRGTPISEGKLVHLRSLSQLQFLLVPDAIHRIPHDLQENSSFCVLKQNYLIFYKHNGINARVMQYLKKCSVNRVRVENESILYLDDLEKMTRSRSFRVNRLELNDPSIYPVRKEDFEEGRIALETTEFDELLTYSNFANWPLERVKINEFNIDITMVDGKRKVSISTEETEGLNFSILFDFLRGFRRFRESDYDITELDFSNLQCLDINFLSKLSLFVTDKNVYRLNLSNTNILERDIETTSELPTDDFRVIMENTTIIDLIGCNITPERLFESAKSDDLLMGWADQRYLMVSNNIELHFAGRNPGEIRVMTII